MIQYAVFHEGQQITDPMSFADANYHAAGITADQFNGDLSSLYEVHPVTRQISHESDICITPELEELARAIAMSTL